MGFNRILFDFRAYLPGRSETIFETANKYSQNKEEKRKYLLLMLRLLGIEVENNVAFLFDEEIGKVETIEEIEILIKEWF